MQASKQASKQALLDGLIGGFVVHWNAMINTVKT
jgi:hypothetical protein